jgi:FixJ family two-component response regulator
MTGTKDETRRNALPRRLTSSGSLPVEPSLPVSGHVHVIDDDESVRDALGNLLRSIGYNVQLHRSASEFLSANLPDTPACLILDVRLPGTNGLELQEYLKRLSFSLPVILMTAYGDIPMSVRGMKAGAVDFLTKPLREQDLLDAVTSAIRADEIRHRELLQVVELRERWSLLTPRERQVISLVASGLMNKQIAHQLTISEVTVKMHRGNAMRKLEAKSVARLGQIAGILDIAK